MNTQISEKNCHCSSPDGLYISNRSLSGLVAFGIIIGAGIFIAGYFYGKKDTIEHLMQNHDQQFFGDHIYASLCQLYNQEPEADNPMPSCNQETLSSGEESIASAPQETSIAQLAEIKQESIQPASSTVETNKSIKPKQYYAQLVGFGTQKAAQQCADRLKKQNLPTIIRSRPSTNSKGKKVTWYQLITPTYTNKQELDQLVDRIAKVEKLKGVSIKES